MTSLLAELRGAVRLMRRQPIFTALLVAVLTIAIGSSVAMFSVLNAVVLRPLPYGAPQQLVWLSSMRPDGTRTAFSIQDFVDLCERDFGVERVGAFANWSANLTSAGTPERLQGMRASANAFAVLRVDAAVGRTFLAADEADSRAVLLGHGLWARRFGGDPSVVGRVLTLNSANLHHRRRAAGIIRVPHPGRRARRADRGRRGAARRGGRELSPADRAAEAARHAGAIGAGARDHRGRSP